MTSIGVVAHSEKTLGKGLEELRSELADAGFADPPWYEVSKSKQMPAKVRKLIDSGIDRLLVWGGDGTVRRCIETIVSEGAHTSVAILPAGTANLLATGLGIPIDLHDAVEVALHGATRDIDVGVINKEVFAVMAGTGFDALMIRDAEDGMKDRMGRLAYVRTGLSNLDTAGAEVTIEVDGKEWFTGRAACVLVGNMGKVLGGIDAFPDARCDDGLLDIGVVMAHKRTDWLRLGIRAITGNVEASPLAELTQGKRIEIRLDRTLPWELDGGDRPRAKKLSVKVLPHRLSVCVPAHG